MTKLEIFKRMMTRAKANGYEGDDYKYQMGNILDGTNYYAVIFRNDFSTALWEDGMNAAGYLHELINVGPENEWKFLEESTNFIDY